MVLNDKTISKLAIEKGILVLQVEEFVNWMKVLLSWSFLPLTFNFIP